MSLLLLVRNCDSSWRMNRSIILTMRLVRLNWSVVVWEILGAFLVDRVMWVLSSPWVDGL